MTKKGKGKILVAMSGGVDSSVAATLLVKAGYDVTGAFMVNYDGVDLAPTLSLKGEGGVVLPSPFKERARERSCWRNDYQDALRVAAKLKIPLLRFDFVKEYKKMVLDYTYAAYSAGRTPNPDILCNKFIKFGVWLEKAKKLGFDKLATGHYARAICHPRESGDPVANCHSDRAKRAEESLYKLIQAKDTNKDQTYFLHQLNQKQLSRILFPIGNYTKPQVRALAKKFDLPTADKAESMGICFVGEVPMREFLKGKVKAKNGLIISTAGELLGEHNGLPFYTIGERGLNIGGSGPWFVVEKDLKENVLVVGHKNNPALFKKEIIVSGVNWIAGQTPKLPLKCKVRLRHRQELQDCVVANCHSDRASQRAEESLVVKFITPQRAVTPGQFAVFYKGKECLGGGEIK